MHYKEYLSAGDDAKLLLAMLPPTNVKLYIFGQSGDWQAFEEEVSLDPMHTLTLWPGEGALTIDQYLSELPNNSTWRRTSTSGASSIDITRNNGDSSEHPMLRVVVLDGVYSHARTMFKTMRQRLSDRNLFPKFVALHPDTLSVYHRAQKNYANASAQTVVKSNNPKALHICTVEASALLLREVLLTSRSNSGLSSVAVVEEEAVNRVAESLVQAVRVNNDALVYCVDVRPVSGVPTSNSSGAAKRSQRKREARERATSVETI